MVDICPTCGEEFHSIGSHWSRGKCDFPRLTDEQLEVITGVLMGDGHIDSRNKNPHLKVNMANEDYLTYLDNIFGILGKGVSLSKTAEKSASDARKYGVDENANSSNYSDIYTWYTVHHSELKQFSNWYSNGGKKWPENIKLTPTILKHLYACDGNWKNDTDSNYIRISMKNEIGNENKIDSYFESAGLPTPSNYDTSETMMNAEFTVSQSETLWEYMGSPLPGFDYKWPERFIC